MMIALVALMPPMMITSFRRRHTFHTADTSLSMPPDSSLIFFFFFFFFADAHALVSPPSATSIHCLILSIFDAMPAVDGCLLPYCRRFAFIIFILIDICIDATAERR